MWYPKILWLIKEATGKVISFSINHHIVVSQKSLLLMKPISPISIMLSLKMSLFVLGAGPEFVRLSQEVSEDIGGIQSNSTEVSKRDSFGMCVVRDDTCLDLFLDLGGGTPQDLLTFFPARNS
jgi:hypothetical protein